MRKPTPVFLSVAVLLLASQACAVPNMPAPTQDLNFLGTAIMSTMVSGATQTALAGVTVPVVDSPSPIPSQTFTPIFTPSATLSPTPVFTSTPAFTLTPLLPLISVSVATNCRTGPGKVYDRVGALLVGEVAEVVGRNANGNYWYIRNPRQSNGFCWLWGQYATVTGNFAALPVFTPPPTPTPMPAFEATYDKLEVCTGWWIDFRLTNTGGIVFESVSITVRDTDTDTVVSTYSDAFTNLNGCVNSTSRERLGPGAKRTVSSSPFAYNPTGHQLRATITVCSRNGLKGTCLTETIRFTPHGID
jgi:hypothetical protein